MEFAVYSRFDEILRQRGVEDAADYVASLGFSAVEIPTSAHALSECAVTSPEQGLRLGEILRRAVCGSAAIPPRRIFSARAPENGKSVSVSTFAVPPRWARPICITR